jgi:hypothetical protein
MDYTEFSILITRKGLHYTEYILVCKDRNHETCVMHLLILSKKSVLLGQFIRNFYFHFTHRL